MLRLSHRGGPEEDTSANAAVPVSPVITLERVSKRFQSTVALHNVSATILLDNSSRLSVAPGLARRPYCTACRARLR